VGGWVKGVFYFLFTQRKILSLLLARTTCKNMSIFFRIFSIFGEPFFLEKRMGKFDRVFCHQKNKKKKKKQKWKNTTKKN